MAEDDDDKVAIRCTVREFARKEVAPGAAERDASVDRVKARELLIEAIAMCRKIGMPKHVEMAERCCRRCSGRRQEVRTGSPGVPVRRWLAANQTGCACRMAQLLCRCGRELGAWAHEYANRRGC